MKLVGCDSVPRFAHDGHGRCSHVVTVAGEAINAVGRPRGSAMRRANIAAWTRG